MPIDAKLLAVYSHDAADMRAVVAGLSLSELNSTPVSGTWSIQQIIVHLMDADLILSDRMKRVIAEDNPSLIGFDESKFIAALHYELWPVEEAITIFELNHKNFAKVLAALPDDAWQRKGTHNEAGVMTLHTLFERSVNHVAHHMKFARQKRQLLGK